MPRSATVTAVTRVVQSSYSTVEWHADGTRITKRFPAGHRRRFENERRVNAALNRRPPVRRPRLLAADRRALELTFDAVDGEPLGPKYPLALTSDHLDDLIDLALRVSRFRPATGRWRRIAVRTNCGDATRRLLDQAIERHRPVWVFAHGDITARNVLGANGEPPVLIDWEWAGIYPRGWELAMVWYAVVDVPGARDRVVDAVVPRDARWFWLAAALLTSMHLDMPSMPSEFRLKHETVLSALLRDAGLRDLARRDVARALQSTRPR